MRREAGKLFPAGSIEQRLTFIVAELVGRRRPATQRARIFRLVLPTLHAAHAHPQVRTGARAVGTGLYRFIDQLHGFTAIPGADQSSSFLPQIALAFFNMLTNAAASARAASVRLS